LGRERERERERERMQGIVLLVIAKNNTPTIQRRKYRGMEAQDDRRKERKLTDEQTDKGEAF
jgi:hypothetical protein